MLKTEADAKGKFSRSILSQNTVAPIERCVNVIGGSTVKLLVQQWINKRLPPRVFARKVRHYFYRRITVMRQKQHNNVANFCTARAAQRKDNYHTFLVFDFS